jgi:hypothetical protein
MLEKIIARSLKEKRAPGLVARGPVNHRLTWVVKPAEAVILNKRHFPS